MTLKKIPLLTIVILLVSYTLTAQRPMPIGMPRNTGSGNMGNPTNNNNGNNNNGNNSTRNAKISADSLKKRDKQEDSITISYSYINNNNRYKLDTNITDASNRYPTKHNYITLGNTGAATKPILFTPNMQAGFTLRPDYYELYKYNLNNNRLFTTNRPYTELTYVIASKAEQQIRLVHAQSPKPTRSFGFDINVVSAPGYLRSQKNNISNFVVNNNYQGKKKRYSNLFTYINNNIKANENGGIKNDSFRTNRFFADRILVRTKLNDTSTSALNPFSAKLETGNGSNSSMLYLRQTYDFGKHDSILINDSTVNHLFYPKLRLAHTLSYNRQTNYYRGSNQDSNYYIQNYGVNILYKRYDEFNLNDDWQNVTNDFSIYQYPDTKNQLQYITAGISAEVWRGRFTQATIKDTSKNFVNVLVHGQYRNTTKNKKWDIDAEAVLHLSGYNAADYSLSASLIRNTTTALGNIELYARQVNRTPSFIYYGQSAVSAFTLNGIKKENITELKAAVSNPKKEQYLSAQLITANNLLTWQGFNKYRQEGLFNLLQITASKRLKVYKKIYLHTDAIIQQVLIGAPKINIAKFYLRNRIGYEGNLGKKNLRLATGLEIRYLAPYKLDAFSPITSQFYYQDSASSSTNLPDVTAYLHFNITKFTAMIRVENIQTVRYVQGENGGIKFMNNNYAATHYLNPGLVFRFGVFWKFIN